MDYETNWMDCTSFHPDVQLELSARRIKRLPRGWGHPWPETLSVWGGHGDMITPGPWPRVDHTESAQFNFLCGLHCTEQSLLIHGLHTGSATSTFYWITLAQWTSERRICQKMQRKWRKFTNRGNYTRNSCLPSLQGTCISQQVLAIIDTVWERGVMGHCGLCSDCWFRLRICIAIIITFVLHLFCDGCMAWCHGKKWQACCPSFWEDLKICPGAAIRLVFLRVLSLIGSCTSPGHLIPGTPYWTLIPDPWSC